MKQVININFQGRVVPIEVTAFEILKNYIETLNKHFFYEEGKEEIINDIESRIGELFHERINKGATCITDDDVNAIISSMGRPEDFETAEQNQNTAAQNAQSTNESANQQSHSSSHKRLYRDENNKLLGGVCSGLANYFNLDITLVRIVFLILVFFFGLSLIPYIILWIVVPNSADKVIGSIRKRLYRDSDDKIIAGVCSGIGNYFGISAWIPRILFILPFLSFIFRKIPGDFPDFLRIGFSPGALVIYIIMWMVLPEALTTAEKLEMKGEKVDIDSIKNSVTEEIKGLKQKAEKFGKEAAAYAHEKGKNLGNDLNTAARKTSRSLGDIIALLFKIFAYFIIGCIVLSLFAALVGLGIASIGIFPLKEFIINDGWQNIFAWGSLIFFIGAPITGILIWLIRRVTKVRSNRRLIRASFIGMWIIGLVCFISLIASVGKEFKHTNENLTEQEIVLTSPKVNKLFITTGSPKEKFIRGRWLRFQPFNGIDEDTAFIKNIDIQIVKSPNDSFKITTIKMADGRTRLIAQQNADLIEYNGMQTDSILRLDRGIAINKTDKFRNQRIVLRIYVPVGKQIKIDEGLSWFNMQRFDTPFNDDDIHISFNDEAQGWETNIDYIMKADGELYTLDGRPAKEVRKKQKRTRVNKNGIEVNDGKHHITINDNGIDISDDEGDDNIDHVIDSINTKYEEEKDSLERKYKKETEKILDRAPNAILVPYGLPGVNSIM